MLQQHYGCHVSCEAALAVGVRPLATELRELNVADLVAFARLDRLGSLRALVQSAAELHFRPDYFDLVGPAEATMGWQGAPVISLSMLYRYSGIEVYFRLNLESSVCSVEIDFVRGVETAQPQDSLELFLQKSLVDCKI